MSQQTLPAAVNALATLEQKRTELNEWALNTLHPALLAVTSHQRKKRKNRFYTPYLDAAHAHARIVGHAASRPGHIFIYPLVGTARQCDGGDRTKGGQSKASSSSAASSASSSSSSSSSSAKANKGHLIRACPFPASHRIVRGGPGGKAIFACWYHRHNLPMLRDELGYDPSEYELHKGSAVVLKALNVDDSTAKELQEGQAAKKALANMRALIEAQYTSGTIDEATRNALLAAQGEVGVTATAATSAAAAAAMAAAMASGGQRDRGARGRKEAQADDEDDEDGEEDGEDDKDDEGDEPMEAEAQEVQEEDEGAGPMQVDKDDKDEEDNGPMEDQEDQEALVAQEAPAAHEVQHAQAGDKDKEDGVAPMEVDDNEEEEDEEVQRTPLRRSRRTAAAKKRKAVEEDVGGRRGRRGPRGQGGR